MLKHYICESKNHTKLQTVEQKKELSTRVKEKQSDDRKQYTNGDKFLLQQIGDSKRKIYGIDNIQIQHNCLQVYNVPILLQVMAYNILPN